MKTATTESNLDLDELKPDSLIEGPMWDGVARFKAFVKNGDTINLLLDLNGKTEVIPLDASQDHGIRLADLPPGKPWKSYVAVERLRHEYARNLGMDGSADPLPHQLKTIYHVSGTPGRIRFMIADEPGGGKTAVASRIIQELFIQKQVKRVLVIAPAMLKDQWQDELKRFVGMESRVIDGNSRGQANPWLSNEKPIIIASMDYAKQDSQMAMLSQAKFDLVVVDEAHNLNATLKKITDRYRLGERLSSISNHVIFLTATPHRGKSDNFRLLLNLLEPDLFADKKMTVEEVFDKKAKLFIRHSKSDMIDMDGKPLFHGRNVVSLKYVMSGAERSMYDVVSEYVRRQYNLSRGRDPNTIASFALLFIQKRMASSTHALLETLRRRRAKLGSQLDEWDGPVDGNRVVDVDGSITDDDDMKELEAEAEGLTLARTREELHDELNELDDLVQAARVTAETKPDTKLEKLLSEITNLGTDKLLIFSEYKDTLNYLAKNIKNHVAGLKQLDGANYEICRIDGDMDMPSRAVAQEDFKNRCQIMLATDAAREGINLQFCHRMVNYDLPWSPIALEQRMGRLHRYGQEKEVLISNMVAADTLEGNVMEKLFDKIRQIESQYPTFNVMGHVLAGGDLDGLMTDVIRHGHADGVDDKVEKAAERAKKMDEMLGHDTPVDVEQIRQKIKDIRSQRTDGEHLVNAATKLFESLGGSIRGIGSDKTSLVVPQELRDDLLDKKRMLLNGTPSEVLARGGDIYDHLMEWVHANCSNDLKSGSVFRDANGLLDGWILFHTVRILNKRQYTAGKQLIAHFLKSDGELKNVDSFILHGMEYAEDVDAGTPPPSDSVQAAALDLARKESKRIADERETFWEYRMNAAKERLAVEKEEISRKIHETGFGNERNKLIDERDKLDMQMKDLQADRDTETVLHVGTTVFEGWVRIVPAALEPQDDVEKIGMSVSMDNEKKDGFVPTDVSGTHGIGYDIRSVHPDGRVREIEVKARCGLDGFQLTESEYHHRKNKNAMIYVIRNAGRPDQHLVILSNIGDLQARSINAYDVTSAEIQRLTTKNQ